MFPERQTSKGTCTYLPTQRSLPYLSQAKKNRRGRIDPSQERSESRKKQGKQNNTSVATKVVNIPLHTTHTTTAKEEIAERGHAEISLSLSLALPPFLRRRRRRKGKIDEDRY